MRETTKEPKMKKVLQRTCCTKSVVCSSPIGNYRADFCDQGLHWVKLCDEVTNDNFLTLGLDEVSLKGKSTHGRVAVQFEKWMKWYFGSSGIGAPEPRPPPICPLVASYESKSFRQTAWLTLRDNVGFGETTSYGRLADMCGRSGASRAVGSAMANNPISLIVPCHRVVKADGKVGNYSKCQKNDVKVWLLNHEKSGPAKEDK